MTSLVRIMVLGLLAFSLESRAQTLNLLPNGDAEESFVNVITLLPGYRTAIEASGAHLAPHWSLTVGAAPTVETAQEGKRAIALQAGASPVSASIRSDYWRVKDPAMPFGLPLLASREVQAFFWYKTTAGMESNRLKATLRLGTIEGLPSATREAFLPASAEWQRIEWNILPDRLLWGAEVAFVLTATGEGETAWIDSVQVRQDFGEGLNLVHNPTFEMIREGVDFPLEWSPPVEDQWVSWVGSQVRPPLLDTTDAATGRRSVRASVTYGEVSGISQKIRLDQEEARPILFGIHSKLDNSIGKSPDGYYGPDNLANVTLFVHHQDGTQQEVSPTFCLGESDHDWDYLRGGFEPRQPVDWIRFQVSLVGTEPTTSLWIDEIELVEIGGIPDADLPSAKFAPLQTLSSRWKTEKVPRGQGVDAVNTHSDLFLSIPSPSPGSVARIFLNPQAHTGFMSYERFRYVALTVNSDGTVSLSEVVEKQGSIAVAEAGFAGETGIECSASEGRHEIKIPFSVLGLAGPPDLPIGLNIEWTSPTGTKYWTGKRINTDNLGSLVCAPRPGISIRSLRFGERYSLETDQSQDLVSHPPVYAGENRAELVLANRGGDRKVDLYSGPEGRVPSLNPVEMKAGEEGRLRIPYEIEGDRATSFRVQILEEGKPLVETSFPLVSPPTCEIVLNQEYYYSEEKDGTAEIHTRLRLLEEGISFGLEVIDLTDGATKWKGDWPCEGGLSKCAFPLEDLRVNEWPIQDYAVEATLSDKTGRPLAVVTAPFGKIHRTQRKPLPPIEKVSVDDKGFLILNEGFRFFPIVPSLSLAEWHEAIDLGANVYRSLYRSRKDTPDAEVDIFEDTDRVWNLGAYTLPVGPGPGQMDRFEEESAELLAHPGFLGCYPRQFYYWNLTEEDFDYRRKVEEIVGQHRTPKLIVWGHHDSSFLYDQGLPEWPWKNPVVGYCYVKIMGRPGPGWRNAPFLTLTEQALNPHRFKLAEVNYYVAWHDDEIVPEHFKTYYSIRGDDWRGMRKEAYLSIIYGANGLYQYLTHQKETLQRLRGWFQELNTMWPVFAAEDSTLRVSVTPADSRIETKVKVFEGKWYLLTANASDRETRATVKFAGIAPGKVRKRFNLSGDLAVSEGSLQDRWGKDDAFVYEIESTEVTAK